MAKIEFPKDFQWGGASSPEQIEGKGNTDKALTIWDRHFELHPEHFFDGVGPEVTSDFFNKYESDIAMFKSMNIKSLRLGVSWARLMPDGIEVSKKGLAFYHKVFKKVKQANISLILNMFHFDMPLWAMDMGGWESVEVIERFVKYTEIIYKEFGNIADYIATMNEPIVPILHGYLGTGGHMPLVDDPRRAFQAGFGTILAHAKAVNLFNDKHRDNATAKIGVVINVAPGIAKDGINPSAEDLKAKEIFDLLHNDSMMYPMILGKFPDGLKKFLEENELMPIYSKEQLEEIARVKIDFLGTNFYAPARVVAPQSDATDFLSKHWSHYHYDKARYNVFRGWEIRPETIYDMAMIIKNKFNNIPFYISENGMGVENEDIYRNSSSGEIQDDYRIAFLQEHLVELNRAINDGANCFGYHMWAITDNWSWRNAYKNRYGFIEVDLNDQSRRFKKSAHWYKETIANNGFDDKFKKIEATIDLAKTKFTKSV